MLVFLSGGVDSDVVARLAVATFGAARVVGATCLQAAQDPAHPENAARLARTLGIEYAQLNLGQMPAELAAELARASPRFDDGENGWLIEARAKCALRTSIAALYHDRGYYILGCGNRTELRLGFFMPLGDGICHAAPILHLFKTEVYVLAQALGTDSQVIEQPPSAGFWPGQSDLEDIAYWMLHGGPIVRPVHFSEEDIAEVERMRRVLSFAGLDAALKEYERGSAPAFAASVSGLELKIVERVYRVAEAARALKLIPMCASLLSEAAPT
ncbi:NAD+ synthetase [Chthoniobacter flavus Ellin428]|uniref:NH(3)-dependent NAD(+) synthetase n=2 Tax=Chthoniobacter flavus TaxID=191863 RepID=B4CXM6_9BACT|nr:NAD(+) synthase [Chthoniobacter flavus]EDY21024.1 NAD+ synthetase [Chthoniobacter flavus Ellin428]TCO88749.1 NAD+ synthase [Chthoniobacter flavus]